MTGTPLGGDILPPRGTTLASLPTLLSLGLGLSDQYSLGLIVMGLFPQLVSLKIWRGAFVSLEILFLLNMYFIFDAMPGNISIMFGDNVWMTKHLCGYFIHRNYLVL